MKQRSFDIIRVPELEETSFYFDNVEVFYVGTFPQTRIAFYCSIEQICGVRVYPGGGKRLQNARGVKNGRPNAHGKKEYLYFNDAFGRHKGILVSHAVWMAAGRTIKPGMTIDHINGCTTDNRIRNLRCITNEINIRDGGFLTKLSNKGIDTTTIFRGTLLRYFDRMAFIKENISKYRYRSLTQSDLEDILIYDIGRVYYIFKEKYKISLPFTSEIM